MITSLEFWFLQERYFSSVLGERTICKQLGCLMPLTLSKNMLGKVGKCSVRNKLYLPAVHQLPQSCSHWLSSAPVKVLVLQQRSPDRSSQKDSSNGVFLLVVYESGPSHIRYL